MKIEAESGIKKEATGKEVSRPPAGRKPRTPRSSRGSIPKKMRHAMTPAQRSFWAGTRLHPRLHGRIARLQWVGRDLVDLVCHDSRLVIEIETEPPVADAAKGARDARLRMVGYQVLRLGNSEVLTHVRSVLDLVAHMIDRCRLEARTTPRPHRQLIAIPGTGPRRTRHLAPWWRNRPTGTASGRPRR